MKRRNFLKSIMTAIIGTAAASKEEQRVINILSVPAYTHEKKPEKFSITSLEDKFKDYSTMPEKFFHT